MTTFKFPRAKIDVEVIGYKPSQKSLTQFKHWHVEALLNSASDLLDRCLDEEAKYDALRAQAQVITDSLVAEDERLKLEEMKISQGDYNHEAENALLKQDGLARLKDSFDMQENELNAAKAPLKPPELNRANADWHEYQIRKARWNNELAQSRIEFSRTQDTLDVDGKIIKVGSTSLQKKILDLARTRHEARKRNVEQDQPLDFQGQAMRCKERMTHDYQDAVNRLQVASIGLMNIYGYTDPFENMLLAIEKGIRAPVDGAMYWTREAIRWLLAFHQNDHAVTVTVSLQRILGQEWSKAYKDGEVIQFDLSNDTFSAYRYVRLRGVSACSNIESKMPPFPIGCSVKVPGSAVYFFKSPEEATDDVMKEASQNEVPPCVLGRVESLLVPHEPEICGAISLTNLSPIGVAGDKGKWSLALYSITNSPLNALQDVLLYFLVSAQPKEIQSS